ncbi:MAG: hypothetical protein NTY41_18100, partial [Proteobacteria bacterium]|nr:hypothetical protein [Pseudomonadota bacterium]
LAVAGAVTTAVREVSLTRNELVFETDAIGQPHLIKFAYHPRWHLVSRGSLHIAGPGFMLVVPQEREIRLAYGHTSVGWLGMLATALAFLCVLWLVWRWWRFPPLAAPQDPVGASSRLKEVPVGLAKQVPVRGARDPSGYSGRGSRASSLLQSCWLRWLPLLAGWVLLGAAGVYFAVRSPERVYSQAWEAMRASQYQAASEKFSLALALRRPPAKKEEALFWLAKASELSGQRGAAKAYYRELCEHYHGYWLPESLYTLVLLEGLDGQAAVAEPYARRLREEYPNNTWALKLDQKK